MDFFPAGDWRLMRRLTAALALLLVLSAGFCHVQRTYAQKFYDVTGEAKWIWAPVQLNADEPLAFFATRDFVLPEKRAFALLKIAGDPQYELYVNGRRLVSRRIDERAPQLDVLDITPFVRTGRNRVVVAVKAPQGFGGLIAALDIAPETAGVVVTDESWRIHRAWNPALLQRDLPGWQRPMVIGEPPVGRWDFLESDQVALAPAARETVATARNVFKADAQIPTIRTSAGIAVAGTDRARATVFDFGPVTGRVRLRARRASPGSRMVQIRMVNDVREIPMADWNLQKVVFAPGEAVVTVPDEDSFRYVMVFGRNVEAEVVRADSPGL